MGGKPTSFNLFCPFVLELTRFFHFLIAFGIGFGIGFLSKSLNTNCDISVFETKSRFVIFILAFVF